MNQEERAKRWSNGESYNRYISAELQSFRKNAWKHQIGQHLEGRKGLEILDVGTGPGFFACILSEEGHHVTGIDSSGGMLEKARENAELLGVKPEFRKMDVNRLDFPDGTFDVVVMRNVTWTLEHPEAVYAEFKRVLKEQGILLIYDANWHMHFYDPEKMKRVREREERYFAKYGRREVVSGGDLEYFASAPLTRTLRPDWDRKTLENLGMQVQITEDVGRFVYEDWEKDLYGESPLFEICAVRGTQPETEKKMWHYWQNRAESFGFDSSGDGIQKMKERFGRYLPKERSRVLDIGTGTGIIALAVSMLGHEVTAVDLCSNMIEKAKENAEKFGQKIQFVCTAADELPFEDNSFDVIVSRNVTWVLPEPEKTFRNWSRVLKPGGLLIYQDANHYYYLFNEEARKHREQITELNGTPHGQDKEGKHDYSLCDDTALELPMSRLNRPSEWDKEELPKLGFDIIHEERFYPQNLLKYRIGTGYYTEFLIVAVNGKSE